MTMSQPVLRGLSDEFLAALDNLADAGKGWWCDVLAHPDLLIAVRREYLNVYHRGSSIFRVDFLHGRPVPVTHFKYLLRQRQAYATLNTKGEFVAGQKRYFQKKYVGPETLREMVAAAKAYAGDEKTGLHHLVKANRNVIDVEIALAGEVPAGGDEE